MISDSSDQQAVEAIVVRNGWVYQEYKDLHDDLSFLAQKSFREIDMTCSKITKKGIQSMAMYNCRNITHLLINWNIIGNKGCMYLTRLGMKNLTHLQIGANKIEAAGMTHLFKGQWKQLKELTLFDNKLSFEAIPHLVRANWKVISSINITWNIIYLFGATYFVLAEMPALTRLVMNCNRISGDVKEVLQNKFKDIKQITTFNVN